MPASQAGRHGFDPRRPLQNSLIEVSSDSSSKCGAWLVRRTAWGLIPDLKKQIAIGNSYPFESSNRKVGMRARLLTITGLVILSLLTAISDADQPSSKPSSVVPVYQPKRYPFDGGEKLTYHASWNGLVSVASATVYTTSEWVNGQKFYNVRVEASSSKLLDFIWKMRDTITSKMNADGLTPAQFTFSQRENSKVIDTVASFDRTTKKWSVHRDERKKVKRYQFDEPNNTMDPITAAYLARSLNFKVGDHLYFHIFGGKYRYLLDLEVERKEIIHLKSGNVEAFKFVPRLEDVLQEGYASRLNEAAVWISADERRLPVLLKGKIIFGSVYLELSDESAPMQTFSEKNSRSS